MTTQTKLVTLFNAAFKKRGMKINEFSKDLNEYMERSDESIKQTLKKFLKTKGDSINLVFLAHILVHAKMLELYEESEVLDALIDHLNSNANRCFISLDVDSIYHNQYHFRTLLVEALIANSENYPEKKYEENLEERWFGIEEMHDIKPSMKRVLEEVSKLKKKEILLDYEIKGTQISDAFNRGWINDQLLLKVADLFTQYLPSYNLRWFLYSTIRNKKFFSELKSEHFRDSEIRYILKDYLTDAKELLK